MSFGFDESYYLSKNPDVTAAVARGQFLSGYDHFVKLGAAELRNPNAFFNAQEYAAANPDVLSAVSQHVFPSLWDHYITFGLAEGRAPSTALAGFNAAAYLAANPDVAAAVTAGTFKSALQHFLSFGAQEGRPALGADGQPLTGGANSGQTFTLTAGLDNVAGTANNDTISGTDATLSAADVIRGGAGKDVLNYTDASVGGTNLPAADVAGVEVINVRNVGTGTAATREVATFTFGAVADTQTLTITPAGGAPVTFPDPGAGGATGAQVAAYFAQTANLPAGYEFVSLNGNQLVLRAVANGNANDLTLGGVAGPASAVNIVQGAAAGAIATNTFSADVFVGATDFNSNMSLGAVTINNLSAGQSVGMIGNGSVTVGALTAGYGNTVTSTTLNLSSGLQNSAAGAAPAGAGAVLINGAGLATATVNSTGGANAIADLDFGGGAALTTLNINATSSFALAPGGSISGFSAGQASTVNVTGAGDVRVNALDAALDVYNAAAATGVQTLSLGAGTQKVTTGSAKDVITTNNVVLTTGTVDAGAGTGDRLVVSNTNDITATTGAFYSNFEQVRVSDGVSLNMDHLSANNSITSIQLHNTAGTALVSNVTAEQAANIQVTNAAAGLITIDVKGASNAGQIDTVKIAATTTTATGAPQNIDLATAPISLASVEKLEITGNGTAAATTGTISLNTDAARSLDSIKLSNAGNGNLITIDADHSATNLVVDVSGSTGNTTINASAYNTTTGVQLIGGQGNDTLTVSARADMVNLSFGGRDIVNFTVDGNAAVSTVAAHDVVKGFGLVTTAINDVQNILATFQNAGVSAGGANADVLNLGDGAAAALSRATVTATPVDVAAASGNAASADIKASVDARGLLTLSGADAALVNTIEEWVGIADLVTGNAAGNADDGKSVVFKFGADSYVFTEIDSAVVANDSLVKLEGVAATGISLVGVAGHTALVGEVLIA